MAAAASDPATVAAAAPPASDSESSYSPGRPGFVVPPIMIMSVMRVRFRSESPIPMPGRLARSPLYAAHAVTRALAAAAGRAGRGRRDGRRGRPAGTCRRPSRGPAGAAPAPACCALRICGADAAAMPDADSDGRRRSWGFVSAGIERSWRQWIFGLPKAVPPAFRRLRLFTRK